MDEVDPIRAARVQQLKALIEDAELDLIGAIDTARAILGRGHPIINRLIGARNIGPLVSEYDPSAWTELVDDMRRAAGAKKDKAAAMRVLPPAGSGIVRGGRMLSKKNAEASTLEDVAAELLAASGEVESAIASVVSARQLHDTEEHENAEENADEAVDNLGEGKKAKKKGGRCTAEFKQALARFNISVQRYWNGSLVGPDCMLLTENYIAVLTQVRIKIDELFPTSSKATAFFDRHAQVLRHIHVIGHLSRKVAMLTAGELDELETACFEFGRVFRVSYPDHPILTVKGHTVEDHLIHFARHYGVLGVFGEDGMEAEHPLDTRMRLLVRTMRNPVARQKALQSHMIVHKKFRNPAGPKRRRRNKTQIAAAAAAADEQGP